MQSRSAEAKDTLRLFFALWPDAPALQLLTRLARKVALERHGRATRDDSLHVTVSFIGGIARERLPGLIAAGLHAAAAADPFTLALDRLGGAGRGGIGWLAPSELPPSLSALHVALCVALAQGGYPVERRPFRPHVTLARHCVRPVDRHDTAAVIWQVDTLTLVASTPEPGGSRYETIAAWPLASAQRQSTGTV